MFTVGAAEIEAPVALGSTAPLAVHAYVVGLPVHETETLIAVPGATGPDGLATGAEHTGGMTGAGLMTTV